MLDGKACGVYCLCIVRVVLRISVVCGLWNGGVCEGRCVVSSLVFLFLFLFLLFVLVFGVVRAQPCEHARYPRTPCVLLLCSLFSAPRLSSRPVFLLLGNGGGVIHHVSVCCVGMTAMGSLSLSSPFFW